MSDKIWIIKEGSQVLGPFNQAEIIAQINNKEILETDQIAAPFSRFEFLKNCEEFNLLFKISDHTEVSKTEHTDATEKIDQVDPSVTGFFDITVQKPKGTSRLPYKKLPASTATVKKKVDQKEITTDGKTIDKPKPTKLLKIPATITEKYKSIQKPLFLLVGLISIGVYLFYQQQQFVTQQKFEKDKINKMLFAQSTINIKLGHYENSLRDLRRILSATPDHPQAFFHLIEVLILQQKYEEAKTLLQERSLNIPLSMKYHLYHYMALIDLQTKELSTAMQNLRNTLEQNPSFPAAIINLGTLYFLNEEYEKAEEQYTSDIIKDIINSDTSPEENHLEFQGILILHRAANAVKSYLKLEEDSEYIEENTENFKKDRANDKLDELILSLEEYQEETYDFKLEALIMRALLELLKGEIEVSENLLRNVLELDLDLTDQHFHNPLYYYLDELLWSNTIMFTFNEIKSKSVDEWRKDPALLAVYGFLNFKTGNKEAGEDYINEALESYQTHHNINIKNLSAYIQGKSNLKEQSCEILASTTKDDLNYLRILLQERLCVEENNVKIRKSLLEDLRLSSYFQLQAFTGLAHVSEKEQDRISAKEYFQEAYDLSKNYKPLLSLQARWVREQSM